MPNEMSPAARIAILERLLDVGLLSSEMARSLMDNNLFGIPVALGIEHGVVFKTEKPLPKNFKGERSGSNI